MASSAGLSQDGLPGWVLAAGGGQPPGCCAQSEDQDCPGEDQSQKEPDLEHRFRLQQPQKRRSL